MKVNLKTIFYILALIALFFMTLTVVYYCPKKPSEPKSDADTVIVSDTILKTDTFVVEKPVPKYIKVIRTDTLYDTIGNEIELKKENKTYIENVTTCAGDTVTVTNYISGYEASLDSLKVKLSKQEITNTVEIVKYITQPKTFKDHFSLGIGVGYGYGLNNKQFEPFVGVSLNYNFKLERKKKK